MPGNGRTAPEDDPQDGFLLFAVVIIVNWFVQGTELLWALQGPGTGTAKLSCLFPSCTPECQRPHS